MIAESLVFLRSTLLVGVLMAAARRLMRMTELSVMRFGLFPAEELAVEKTAQSGKAAVEQVEFGEAADLEDIRYNGAVAAGPGRSAVVLDLCSL